MRTKDGNARNELPPHVARQHTLSPTSCRASQDRSRPVTPLGAVLSSWCAVLQRTVQWKMKMHEMSFLRAPHTTTRAPRKLSRTVGLLLPSYSHRCSGTCLTSCVVENSMVEDANARETIFLRARHATTCVSREPSCTREWPTMQTVCVLCTSWEISDTTWI